MQFKEFGRLREDEFFPPLEISRPEVSIFHALVIIVFHSTVFSPSMFVFRIEMRRIARNAGSAIGANLSYHTNHEVAQVSYGHVWRKRVELCNRFEELLYLMRILESSLDRDVSQML